MYMYYETNTVWVPMKNGTLQRAAYNNNLNPWRNQYVLEPMNCVINTSAFKATRITERFTARFDADFFTVLNMPLLGVPDSTTVIITKQFSWNGRGTCS